ncbi:hypothetical protein SAMN04489832_6246 [Micromonospora cremea]|uniref:Uncharacterized protein n=1 Tax=Micromonospora cremea TaxID=709881 RepID=A0A1N6AW03_9ACTN|nr:hypothetical protein SAMN04489832_6246 [Micromonospora cremea]
MIYGPVPACYPEGPVCPDPLPTAGRSKRDETTHLARQHPVETVVFPEHKEPDLGLALVEVDLVGPPWF